MPRHRSYDYVVVGAGPAGCAVAARLSRLPGCRVLLIEAGGTGRSPLIAVPLAALLLMRHPRYTWRFETEPQPELAGRTAEWYAGRLLGGGSAINGMMYLRGQPSDYDRWRDEAGCPGWGFADALPFFRRAEASDRGASYWHGASGPVRISSGRPDMPIAAAFLDMVAAAGLPVVDDLNAGADEGFGFYDRLIGGGRRSSASAAYLRGVADHRALTVMTGARACGLVIEQGRVRGVRMSGSGEAHTVQAESEVILSMGCVNSAQQLLLSGIGPADELRSLDIAIAADSPEVGRNVQNHIAQSLMFRHPGRLTAFEYRRPRRALAAAAEYALRGTGILSGLLCPAGGLFKSDPGGAAADTQVIMAAGLPGIGGGWKGVLPRDSGFTLMVNQGRPFSRGTIRLRSADPLAPPVIRSGHFTDVRDLPLLVAAVMRLREIVLRNPIAGAFASETGDQAVCRDEAAMAELIRHRAQSYHHMVGSCRMGSDRHAVVDTALRVRGVEGLRIADASVAPLLVNGNTTAMALMIGERAAAMIAGE